MPESREPKAGSRALSGAGRGELAVLLQAFEQAIENGERAVRSPEQTLDLWIGEVTAFPCQAKEGL